MRYRIPLDLRNVQKENKTRFSVLNLDFQLKKLWFYMKNLRETTKKYSRKTKRKIKKIISSIHVKKKRIISFTWQLFFSTRASCLPNDTRLLKPLQFISWRKLKWTETFSTNQKATRKKNCIYFVTFFMVCSKDKSFPVVDICSSVNYTQIDDPKTSRRSHFKAIFERFTYDTYEVNISSFASVSVEFSNAFRNAWLFYSKNLDHFSEIHKEKASNGTKSVQTKRTTSWMNSREHYITYITICVEATLTFDAFYKRNKIENRKKWTFNDDDETRTYSWSSI